VLLAADAYDRLPMARAILRFTLYNDFAQVTTEVRTVLEDSGFKMIGEGLATFSFEIEESTVTPADLITPLVDVLQLLQRADADRSTRLHQLSLYIDDPLR
jgi:hypothetical protein